MSKCILTSYYNHLNYLDLEPTLEKYIYLAIRAGALVESGAYTPGSLCPLIYTLMAKARGLELTIQSRRGTKEFYLQCLEDELQREIVRISDFGEEVDKINLMPAIYLVMNRSHAEFVEPGMMLIEQGVVIEAAFQFRRKTT